MKSSSSMEMSQDTVNSSGNRIYIAQIVFNTYTQFSRRQTLTDFQSGERVVNDADKHPFCFHMVNSSIQSEGAWLLHGVFDQHITPVEVPEQRRGRFTLGTLKDINYPSHKHYFRLTTHILWIPVLEVQLLLGHRQRSSDLLKDALGDQ